MLTESTIRLLLMPFEHDHFTLSDPNLYGTETKTEDEEEEEYTESDRYFEKGETSSIV